MGNRLDLIFQNLVLRYGLHSRLHTHPSSSKTVRFQTGGCCRSASSSCVTAVQGSAIPSEGSSTLFLSAPPRSCLLNPNAPRPALLTCSCADRLSTVHSASVRLATTVPFRESDFCHLGPLSHLGAALYRVSIEPPLIVAGPYLQILHLGRQIRGNTSSFCERACLSPQPRRVLKGIPRLHLI